ncbi:hypothetical protein BKP35_10385 [Anaerobacillus arseniciselenatis]|uniref:Uncharacterized protein n=1 Tax=Anaerobacillus arseniciselenatis TaxID=85682 RepID=A0A1S2LK95_9BACI|nr:hypothetical protein [Anaerobacillus arseniciselenatis]OIJ12958.1 hypothetical protein BKP35_10385 [Anaerobacillus arseniciselenatis]
MSDKKYYSERNNIRERERYNEKDLSELFVQTYYELSDKKMFEELIGYTDTWGNRIKGKIAGSFDTFVFKRIGKRDLVPIDDEIFYREDDVFDLMELFYDYVSQPVKIQPIREYDKEAGKNEFRKEMNTILNNYGKGFELSVQGYIREIIDTGLEKVVDEKHEFVNDDDSEKRIEDAKKKFFHYKADEADKRGAILEVGAVLEKLKKTGKLGFNKKDENDLFEVLNNFSLRHNRPDQKPNYDKGIFYPWLFFNLLSAVDASLKLQKRKAVIF